MYGGVGDVDVDMCKDRSKVCVGEKRKKGRKVDVSCSFHQLRFSIASPRHNVCRDLIEKHLSATLLAIIPFTCPLSLLRFGIHHSVLASTATGYNGDS